MDTKYTWLILLLELIRSLKLQIALYVQIRHFGPRTVKFILVIALIRRLYAFTMGTCLISSDRMAAIKVRMAQHFENCITLDREACFDI